MVSQTLLRKLACSALRATTRRVSSACVAGRRRASPAQCPRRPKLTDTEHRELLRRCFRLISHEMCHVLGLRHCIYYSCLMNGVNNDEEMDRTPLHLCPICLRKLCSVPMLAGHGTAAVDVRLRYVDMHEVFTTHGRNSIKCA